MVADRAYLDASAIVKLARREAESEALENTIINREALFSSWIGAAEAFRAVRRSDTTQLEVVLEVFDAIFFHAVTLDILHRSRTIDPPALRTGDAIHLATALSLGDPALEFITYDQRQAKAARALGLAVFQPGLRL